jgi:hypothetical protein
MSEHRRHRSSDDQSTVQERVSAWAAQLRAQAAQLPPGPKRDGLLMKAREADMSARINGWINSRGLQPPK